MQMPTMAGVEVKLNADADPVGPNPDGRHGMADRPRRPRSGDPERQASTADRADAPTIRRDPRLSARLGLATGFGGTFRNRHSDGRARESNAFGGAYARRRSATADHGDPVVGARARER